MTPQKWYNDNYKFLQTWSKRWSPNHWSDLLSMYYIYLDSNWLKFSNIPDDEGKIKFTQVWFKNNTKWSNSDFNKAIRVNNYEEEWDIAEEAEDSFIEVLCETDREDIREFMLDLNKRFSEFDVNRIMKMRRIYLTLNTHQKVLYDLYITHDLSMRAIGKKLDLPLSAVYNMITELKKEINLCMK